jgi:hypothetical protein
MAAPAAAARNRRAGRPRPVVRRHQDRLPSMAGRWGDEGRRKPPRRGVRLAASPHGSTAPGTEKPPVERRGARVSLHRTHAAPQKRGEYVVAPRGAPRPLAIGEGNGTTGLPGAATKNTGDGAWVCAGVLRISLNGRQAHTGNTCDRVATVLEHLSHTV